MIYVLRDETGKIIAVSEKTVDKNWTAVDKKDPELLQFIQEKTPKTTEQALESSDLGFIRVLEDLVELMIEKNLISFTDFPRAAQKKLLMRRGFREQLRSKYSIDLIGQEDDDLKLL